MVWYGKSWDDDLTLSLSARVGGLLILPATKGGRKILLSLLFDTMGSCIEVLTCENLQTALDAAPLLHCILSRPQPCFFVAPTINSRHSFDHHCTCWKLQISRLGKQEAEFLNYGLFSA